jgi:hypothetical protein
MKMKLLSTFFAMLVFGAPKNHLKEGGVDEKIYATATYLNEDKGQDYSVVVGCGYNTDKDVYFIAKWVHDYHAEKRIKGDYAYVSLALSF